MLSGKLIRLIESHEEEITAGVVRSIHRDSELPPTWENYRTWN
jgi:hypothetical protein